MAIDLSMFYTQQASTGVTAQTPVTQAGGEGGLFAMTPGADFMSLILASLTGGDALTKDNGAPTGGDKKKNADPLAALMPLTPIATPNVNESVKIETALDLNFLTNNGESDMALIALDTDSLTPEQLAALDKKTKAPTQEDFMAFLNQLLAGIPSQSRPTPIDLGETDLSAETITDLTTAPVADESAAPLIATGLTAEDLTKFMEELKTRAENGESFIVGLIKIMPPESKQQVVLIPRALIMGKQALTDKPADVAAAPQKPAATQIDVNAGEDIIAAKLNELTVGATDETTMDKEAPSFDAILKILEKAQNKGQPDIGNIAPRNDNTPKASNSALNAVAGVGAPAMGLSCEGSLFTTDHLDDTLGIPGLRTGALGASLTTNLVSNAPQAGQPHPASQLVAVAIAKGAAQGETKSLNVRLDPPELGRVEVRMTFAKDKTMKAHVIAEKPETYMMLQRDSHALERALQDNGVSMDGGMSFELAQDGGFSNEGRGGRDDSGGGSTESADAGENEIIIETTMNWHVDPQTGLTRYDILA